MTCTASSPDQSHDLHCLDPPPIVQGENIIHGYSCRLEGCGVDMFGLLHTLASTSNTATAGSFKVRTVVS